MNDPLLLSLVMTNGSVMNAHILMIGNQINLARFVEMELHAEGYRVSRKSDGVSGVSALQASQPDLVILDGELLRRAGLDICQHLRDANQGVPIILLTTKEDWCGRFAEPAIAISDYLVKPFTMDDLLLKIQHYLPDQS